MKTNKTCAIVLNTPNSIKNIEESFIIAADGGYQKVIDQNKEVDIFIGDFDSSKEVNAKRIIKLNPIKNDTDGQAAVQYAIDNDFSEISLYGITGGRLDHVLCNLSLLVKAKKQGLKAVAKEQDCTIYFLEEGSYDFSLKENTTISLIAYPQALIDNSKGLKYGFSKLLLVRDELGRAVSNETILKNISFDILDGSLLLIIND